MWLLIVLLIVLHQDFWLWEDGRLIAGFLPIGLAWHMLLSMAAAATWWLATKVAWPADNQPDTTSEWPES